MIHKYLLSGLLGLAACSAATSQVDNMAPADARKICELHAQRYALRPIRVRDEKGVVQVGLQAELPDSFQVADFYRACYFQRTGERTRDIPKITVYT